MGTPEFPNLGKHCSVGHCRQIDFLPFTCDRCNQILCLEHRGYAKHSCPNANQQDVTVLVCPLCAKGVHLVSNEDPNATWEAHVNTDCDPSNYQKATNKKRCPVPHCKETLVFSNTIKCRDCSREHCLKHRFGPDHNCSGPRKPDAVFPFMGMLKGSQKGSGTSPRSSGGPAWWGSGFLGAASSVRASAEASLAKLGNATSQALQKAKDGMSLNNVGGDGLVEQCVQCPARFSSVTALIEHVEKIHESGSGVTGRMNTSIDVCPKCSKGFNDPVSLVMHVERDHGGTSTA
uniref:Zinc finger AN1 and C2H2 domain-containing stress-associated protein 16 n=1 Tax=Anthurium amnicola TaxID=1678845 RepID=A0A1D1ZJF8_9ARAE